MLISELLSKIKCAIRGFVLLGLVLQPAAAIVGHATFYGNSKPPWNDPYTLAEGTCACYKTKDKKVTCPRNTCFRTIQYPNLVGALSTAGTSNTKHCGACFSIKCVDGPLRGLPNSKFSKTQACKDKSKTIEIMVTDSCPQYHRNQPGNQLWCVPNEHIDLSFDAFQLLADPKQGLIDTEMKMVGCQRPAGSYGVKLEQCTKKGGRKLLEQYGNVTSNQQDPDS